jgi:integrase/recombinase XerD
MHESLAIRDLMFTTEEQRISPRVSVHDAINDFLLDCGLRNLSDRSVEWYTQRLRALLAPWSDLPLAELSYPGIRTKLADQAARTTPATVNGYIRALKAFLNWADREGCELTLKPSRLPRLKEPKKIPVTLSPEQILALLQQPKTQTFVGLRDYTMLMLMIDTGIRVGELVALQPYDLRPSTGLPPLVVPPAKLVFSAT